MLAPVIWIEQQPHRRRRHRAEEGEGTTTDRPEFHGGGKGRDGSTQKWGGGVDVGREGRIYQIAVITKQVAPHIFLSPHENGGGGVRRTIGDRSSPRGGRTCVYVCMLYVLPNRLDTASKNKYKLFYVPS